MSIWTLGGHSAKAVPGPGAGVGGGGGQALSWLYLGFLYFSVEIFIWLHRVLIVARGILFSIAPCGMGM